MIIRGMSLPLIISCFFIGAILIIFPLIISYKAEKNKTKNEWNKIGASVPLMFPTLPVIGTSQLQIPRWVKVLVGRILLGSLLKA